jgi:tRNA (guanine9-N1)-methyltransferase
MGDETPPPPCSHLPPPSTTRPDDEASSDPSTPPSSSVALSKSALKKLCKRQAAAEKKQRTKQDARATRQRQALAAGRDLAAEARLRQERTQAGDSKWRRQREEHWQREQLPLAQHQSFRICLDCSFDSALTPKETLRLASQLRYCYAANKKARHPCLWAATSVTGATAEHLSKEAGYSAWSQRAYTGTAQSLEDYYGADQLSDVVYLTADSEHTLTELDNSKIYVIGGIVDRNRLQRAAYDRAHQMGVATAKLPLDDYLQSMPSTRVLTCNHVFELLLQYRACDNDWGAALKHVLPPRKQAQLKASNDNNNGRGRC